MNKKAAGWSFIKGAFTLIVIITLIAYFAYKTVNNVNESPCNSQSMVCAPVEECYDAKGVILAGVPCDEGSCCAIKDAAFIQAHRRQTAIDPNLLEEESEETTDGDDTDDEDQDVENSPVSFLVTIDDVPITTNTNLEAGTQYEIKVSAIEEYAKECKATILYYATNKPEGENRIIKTTGLFQCQTGQTMNFIPENKHVTYSPIKLDVQSTKDAVQSAAYGLSITSGEGPICQQDHACTDYQSSKETCNLNPCDVNHNGVTCTWLAFTTPTCGSCTAAPGENNCQQYLDEETCNTNPCEYNGCEWDSNGCA